MQAPRIDAAAGVAVVFLLGNARTALTAACRLICWTLIGIGVVSWCEGCGGRFAIILFKLHEIC